MHFQLLGPVAFETSEGPVSLGGATPRTLLSLLLLARGKVVSADRLMEVVWGEDPPHTVRDTLQSHLSRLRRVVGEADGSAARLVRQGGGYAVTVPGDAVDAHRFRDLVAQAVAAAVPASERSRLLGQALALWRGAPLGGTCDTAWVRDEVAALENLRLAALEARFDADLRLGRHRDVVGELETVTAREPSRERFHAQLMVALFRCSRQIEALGAFQRVRAFLNEEYGVEPGEELQQLQRRVLRNDRALRWPDALDVASVG